MALNFKNVQNAYKVFNELKKTVLLELDIPSWPEDMREWQEKERKNPELCKVYGFDKKCDDGWESLVFFVKNPSEELKTKFSELKSFVHNSAMAEPYSKNSEIWIFGWF
jgi:hypothetical protein